MPNLKDELIALIEASATIAALTEDDRTLLTTRLLALDEAGMQKAVDCLKEEQKAQQEAMKDLVSKIEAASRNMKKLFLKDKEHHEQKDTATKTDALMEELDKIN